MAGSVQPSQERYDPVDIRLFLMSLRLSSAYVPKKDQMHNPTRKLPIRARKETRDLVLSLWPKSSKKLALRSIATSSKTWEHIYHAQQKGLL
jgi:hypothetical protein